MSVRKIYIVLLVSLLTATAFAQTPVTRDIIRDVIALRGQAEVLIKYPGSDLFEQINRTLSVSGLRDGMAEIVLAARDTSWFFSLELPVYVREISYPKSVLSARSMEEAMNWDIYPTCQQYDSIMSHFAASYPDICRLDTIGITYMGRAVLALKISDNVSVEESEPAVFFTSTMHGDELAGFVLLLRLSEYLLESYPSAGLARQLIDSLEIWINPLANPDGTYTSFDTTETRDTILFPTRVNSVGTDLNRSFPGPVSDQAPDMETNNFIAFQEMNRFSLSVNLHSGEEVINYPWDTWTTVHPDDDWFEMVSREWADTVHAISGEGYLDGFDNGIVRGSLWYQIRGGRQDYITWAQHGREVTAEIDKTKLTPGSGLHQLWQYNHRSMLRYAENAMFGLQGFVTDKKSGQPLEASVITLNHDLDGSHVVSDSSTGYYVRLIAPGSWDFVFTADGYKPDTLYGIAVNERQQVRLSVALEPLGQDSLPDNSRELILYPVPAADNLNIMLSDLNEGEGELSIITLQGQTVLKRIHHFSSGQPVTEEISHLAPGLYICRVIMSRGRGRFESPLVKR
jgi:hypothetical protein